jgi:hypothetical protein
MVHEVSRTSRIGVGNRILGEQQGYGGPGLAFRIGQPNRRRVSQDVTYQPG